MLLPFYQSEFLEAGCDEAGRGCLAGPVFAAAVILPKDYQNPLLNDSKQLSEKQRFLLRTQIENEALAYAIASVDHQKIDEINILNASFLAMHWAIEQLNLTPEFLIIDGNRFKKYANIPHQCIIKGDAKYSAIAAASILAKTYRDEYMTEMHHQYPAYHWKNNKGYPTAHHRKVVLEIGLSSIHRKTFKITSPDYNLFEQEDI
jgi:ribonuclease HII